MCLCWRWIISGKFNPHDVGCSNYHDTAVSGMYGSSVKKNFSESLGDFWLCTRIFLPPRRQKIASPIFFTSSCVVKEEMGLLLRLKSNFYPSYISTSRSYYHYITNDIKCQDILSNMWRNISQCCLQCSEHARLVPFNQLDTGGNLRDTQFNRPS